MGGACGLSGGEEKFEGKSPPERPRRRCLSA